MPSKFVTDAELAPCVEEMFQSYAEGNLHSRSSTREALPIALDILADHSLPQRRSLAGLIAKRAQAIWAEEMLRTKRKIEA